MYDEVYNKRLKELAKITPEKAKESPFYKPDTFTEFEYKILPLITIVLSIVYVLIFGINLGTIKFFVNFVFGSEK